MRNDYEVCRGRKIKVTEGKEVLKLDLKMISSGIIKIYVC
jgi:hypothetical protein